jgi:cell division protein FtsQ
MVAFVVFALYYFSQSPFFALEQIRVNGLKHLSPSEVSSESGLSPGTNIFRLNLEQAERRLLADPWIESASLKRQLPRTVQIVIRERQPSALLYASQRWLVLDSNGVCIDSMDTAHLYSLPIITGLQPDTCDPGKRVSANPVLPPVLAALGLDVEDFFSEIDISHPDDLVAYTRDGIPVILGRDDDLHSKLAAAQSLLISYDNPGSVAYVDLRAVQAPAVKNKAVSTEKQKKMFIGD